MKAGSKSFVICNFQFMHHLPFTGESLKDPESRFAMRLHSNVCNGPLAGILLGTQLDLSPFHQMWNLGELVAKV